MQIVALRDFVTEPVGVTIMLHRMSYVYFSTTWWCYNVNINVSNILYPIPKNVKRGKMYGNTESIIWFLFGIEWQDGILLNLYDIFYIGRTLFYANLCHKSCFFRPCYIYETAIFKNIVFWCYYFLCSSTFIYRKEILRSSIVNRLNIAFF